MYDKRGGSQEQVKEVMDMAEVKGELMGDVNKIVPECKRLSTSKVLTNILKHSPYAKSSFHE